MQVSYKSADGRFGIVVEARDQQTAFKEIADFQEIFEGAPVVIDGVAVPSENIRFRVRTVDKNDFYEKVYVGSNPDLWGYKLELGCSLENKGALFPKRKDKEGNYRKNDGWYKFSKNDSTEQKPTEEKSSKSNKSDKAPF